MNTRMRFVSRAMDSVVEFINPARDIQMSGDIYKYREGYTNIGGDL